MIRSGTLSDVIMVRTYYNNKCTEPRARVRTFTLRLALNVRVYTINFTRYFSKIMWTQVISFLTYNFVREHEGTWTFFWLVHAREVFFYPCANCFLLVKKTCEVVWSVHTNVAHRCVHTTICTRFWRFCGQFFQNIGARVWNLLCIQHFLVR